MAVGENLSVDPGLIHSLARHLEHLERHPDGGELLRLINDALHHCHERGLVNGSCLAHLNHQLLAYTQDNNLPSAIRLRARLIQQHLSIYLPQPDHVIPARTSQPAPTMTLPDETAPAARASRVPHPQLTETPSVMESPRTPEQEPAPAAAPAEPARTRADATATTSQNLDELRQMLAKGMDEMLREREALAQQLSDATT